MSETRGVIPIRTDDAGRMLTTLNSELGGVVAAPADENDMSTLPFEGNPPTYGSWFALAGNTIWTILDGETVWKQSDREVA